MENNPNGLSIGGFAAAAGVNVETIRFYQRKGLLPRTRRAYGSIRRYGAADVARVKFVKSAQRLGFTLGEIGALLTLDDGTHCAEARVLAGQKLADIRAKLDDLRRMESALSRLVVRCGKARGRISCPLIAALHTA
ncbi:Hg(II)-responsive transcriptional regulator [soil metagenome]|jgi:MerR family mercuric resistance operon transcriptional regulator